MIKSQLAAHLLQSRTQSQQLLDCTPATARGLDKVWPSLQTQAFRNIFLSDSACSWQLHHPFFPPTIPDSGFLFCRSTRFLPKQITDQNFRPEGQRKVRRAKGILVFRVCRGRRGMAYASHMNYSPMQARGARGLLGFLSAQLELLHEKAIFDVADLGLDSFCRSHSCTAACPDAECNVLSTVSARTCPEASLISSC